jgi:excisionase family DNA binding protein
VDASNLAADPLDTRGRLCRVPEACRYLSLSRSKIYELMDSGVLEYVKIGRARRIPIAAILALVEAHRVAR